MNKTKHFKRTALPVSAKSWVSLLLLLIAMLMPQGAWATDFIKEIKISVCDYDKNDKGATARNRLTNDGYKLVDADLNGGAGASTNYVYIGYKTTTNAAEAITGLLIVESNSNPVFDAHAFDNITNANVTYNGKNYYRCDNYKVHDDGRLDCDLNRKNSKGADIVLFYTKEGNTSNGGTPLTSITVVGNTTETGVTYTRHWQYGTAQDGTSNTDVYGNTNQGNGTAHYITYTTHTHAYSSYTTTATEHDVFCSCSTKIVDDEHHQNVNGKCSVCSHDLKDWTFFYKTKSGNAIKPSWTPDFGATLLSNNYVDGQGYMNFDGPITRLNDKVFVNRTDLTGSLVIPNSVTSIGASAFENCTGLNGTLTLGSSLKSIGNKAFYYCSNLTGDLTIPNSVTSIGEYAFIGCSGFNGKLTLSNTLSSLGQRAFEECKNLTGALTIPNTLKSIPYSAFYNCSKLTSVTFHNSLTSIGQEAFYYCTAFTGTLTIPASVTSIGAKAFSYTKFSTIHNERTTPQTYDLIFGIISGLNVVNTPVQSMKLEVPSSAVAAYRAAAGWNEFKSIVCISHSLNHKNTDAAYAKDPVTCTTAGTYYYSCSVCGEKSTNSTFTVAALQHDYSVMSTDEAYHKDNATCLSAATYWKKCSRCTAKSTKDFFTSTDDKDKALGHSYGEGVWSWKWDDEEHSATCTRTCTRTTCTDKTTGHTASAKVTLNNGIDDGELTEPATCTAMGTTTYTATATVENVEYKSTNEVADIAMLPHTFDQHVCTGCSADEEPAVTGTQGECTWRIYASDGEMIVSPTNGVSGSLGDWDETPSWYEQRTEIKSVRFTGSVTANTLYQVFHQCNNITSIDLTNLNTSQVQNMSYMFNQCMSLTTINWGSFDTNNATDMNTMFNYCENLTSLDLSFFNTSNVTDMNFMFHACSKLTNVDLSSFDTKNVTDFLAMFAHCDKLTNVNLSNFNTANATNMNYMFEYCGELQSLTIGNFDMSKATTCSDMFAGTDNLSTLTLTSVPYLKEGTFDTKFADKTVICQLDENSTVYKGENPGFPTVTSVTAPCSLDLTGSAVANYDINLAHNMVDGSCTECGFPRKEVTYLDANGKQQTAKAFKLTPGMEGDYVTTDKWGYYLASGWYYVEGELNLNNYLNLGDGKEVNIILADGCVWNEGRGISAYNNTTLNIYCQSQKTGTVNLMGNDAVNVSEGGTINIYGGTFTNTASNYNLFYAGDGGNLNFYDANVRGLVTLDGGHITLYGGTFTNLYGAFQHEDESSDNPFQLGAGKAFYDSEGKAVELKFDAENGWYVSTLTTYIVRSTSSSDGDEISYLDANGKQQTAIAIKLTADMQGDYVTTNQRGEYFLASGWYYVDGELNLNNYLNLKDGNEVNIILADGCQWTLNKDLYVFGGATLNIYCQSQKTGTQKVNEYRPTYISENATVNVYGGNFVGNDDTYTVLDVQGDGNLNIFDANVTGVIFNSYGNVTIDGGTFTGGNCALLSSDGIYTLNGGTFTGGECAFVYEYYSDNVPFQLGTGKAFYDSEGNAVDLEFASDDKGRSFVSTHKTYIVRSTSSSDGDEVSYLDANGKQQTVKAIKLTADMEGDYVATNQWGDYFLASGWYYVDGELDLGNVLNVQNGQEVNIILTDGCQWTLKSLDVIGGIDVFGGATLNIYWQSQKTGTQKIVDAYTLTRVRDNATVNVYGGNFVGNDDTYEVFEVWRGGNLHIFDANVSGQISNCSIVTIDGGTFKAGNYALHNDWGTINLNGGTFTGGVAAFAYDGSDNTEHTFFRLGSGKAFYDSEGNAVNLEFDLSNEGCISTLKTYTVRNTSSSDDDEPASISSLVKTIEKLKDPNSGVTIEKINEIVDKLLGKEKQDGGHTEKMDEEDFIW